MHILPDQNRLTRLLPVLGIIAVIVMATGFTAIMTGSGLAIEGDGYYYINAARIMAASLGMGEMVHLPPDLLREYIRFHAFARELWPPFYPALLAAVSFSADPYVAGRWLHLAFPAVMGLLLWLIFIQNGKTRGRALAAVALVLLSPPLLRLNSFMFSETPFLILQVLTLLAVGGYLRRKKISWLAAAIVFIALACLTRYIGVVMALALACLLWRIHREMAFFRRLGLVLTCVALCLLPVTLYMLSSILYGQTLYVAGRSLALDWPLVKIFVFFKKSISSSFLYLAPEWWPRLIRYGFVLLASAGILLFAVRQFRTQSRQPAAEHVRQLQTYIAFCLVIYVVLTSLLALFLDHMLCYTGITARHFAPVFIWLVVLLLLTGPAGPPAADVSTSLFPRLLPGILAAGLILASLSGSIATTARHRDMSAGSQNAWKNSTALAYVRHLRDTPWLVSNLPGEIFHYLRVPVFALPAHYDFFKAQENHRYERQMAYLRKLLHQHDGMVLYFNLWLYRPPEAAAQATSLEECLERLDLEVFYRERSCLILTPRPDPTRAGEEEIGRPSR